MGVALGGPRKLNSPPCLFSFIATPHRHRANKEEAHIRKWPIYELKPTLRIPKGTYFSGRSLLDTLENLRGVS